MVPATFFSYCQPAWRPFALKPEAQAEGNRVGSTGSDPHSLGSRLGLRGHPDLVRGTILLSPRHLRGISKSWTLSFFGSSIFNV
jgi:hypothetical protein